MKIYHNFSFCEDLKKILIFGDFKKWFFQNKKIKVRYLAQVIADYYSPLNSAVFERFDISRSHWHHVQIYN